MRRKRRGWARRAARTAGTVLLLAGAVLIVLARPVLDADLETSAYYRESVARLDEVLAAQGPPPPETALWGGVASLEISPPTEWKVPMAGNRRLWFTRAEGSRPESVWARALALRQGERRLILVSADVMVISPTLASRVLDRVGEETGARAGELFLVAAHTHCGPGGYWPGSLAEQSVGPFDPRVLDYLVERLSQAALDAWASQRPVTVAFASRAMEKPIRNRAGRLELENADLGLVRFASVDGSFTVDLVNYSAHPVALLRDGALLSGDYPALMASRLDDGRRTMIFTPGSIGDMKPVWDGVREPDLKARSIADHLVDEGIERMTPEPLPGAVLESFEVEVTMPPLQARVFRSDLLGSWALRDWLTRRLFPSHLQRATVQVARIGPVVLLGVPADLASSVALPLLERARLAGLRVLFVSMAEEWIGYVLEADEYRDSDYKTTSQFHGAQTGPLFTAVYARIIDWLAGRPSPGSAEADVTAAIRLRDPGRRAARPGRLHRAAGG